METYTLDAHDWPLIINRGDAVVALFPLPKGSSGDDDAGLEQVRLANLAVELFNRTVVINSLRDLMAHFDATTVSDLERRVYKATDCGATISLHLADGTVLHTGDFRRVTMTGDEALKGFTIQTIIEGLDKTVDSDLFLLPVTGEDVENWLTEMVVEVESILDEAGA